MSALNFHQKYVDYAFDVRWRLEYWVNRAPVYGIWTCDGMTAWDKPKEGLARACIEARNRATYETKVVAECSGQDFIEFRWMMATSIPQSMIGKTGNRPLTGSIQGISLVSRSQKIHAYLDGNLVVGDYDEGKVISQAWKV